MHARPAIRVFIVDDQTMIRAGFRRLLSKNPRFEVVGDSGNPRQAIDVVRELRPDIVLLDISMPGLSGIDAVPLLREAYPKVRIVMLTHHAGHAFIVQARRAGAEGYFLKDSDPARLPSALESVHEGKFFLSPGAARSALQYRRELNAERGARRGGSNH